jgi:hypothetical protein
MLHFVLFHSVPCYTNSIASCIHVNTTRLRNITCSLIAMGVILRSLECIHSRIDGGMGLTGLTRLDCPFLLCFDRSGLVSLSGVTHKVPKHMFLIIMLEAVLLKERDRLLEAWQKQMSVVWWQQPDNSPALTLCCCLLLDKQMSPEQLTDPRHWKVVLHHRKICKSITTLDSHMFFVNT